MAIQKNKKNSESATIFSGSFVVGFDSGDIRGLLSGGGAPMVLDVSIARGDSLNVAVAELARLGYQPEDMLAVYPDARRIVTKVSAELVDIDNQPE
jgi:hypothetical protein